MKRMMIQADERLLERARRRAAERGVSVAQVVRDALEKELGYEQAPPPPLACIGAVSSTSGDLSRRASEDEFEPEPYR
jgi:hypothetical protein